MMRSLYSGVSGLRTHQTRMDVIGNNIANVNTTAYKSKSMNFSDMLYQTTQSATGPNIANGTAGTNPRQIGLGVKTGAINTSITTEGASQSTGNPFDIKLTGEAFFIVSDGTNQYFTRDGSFNVDAAGYLCMSNTGYIVQGWTNTDDDTGAIIQDTVKPIQVMSEKNTNFPASYTTAATISGIIDKYDDQLDTEYGKIMNIQTLDDKGYEYNLKFGIKPVQTTETSTRDIVNTENEYTLSTLYQVDTSDITYTYVDPTTGNTNTLSATSSPELMSALEKAIWTTIQDPTQATTTGVALTSYALGQPSTLTINVATFLTYSGLNGTLLNFDAINQAGTITATLSGDTGFVTTSTGAAPTYPLGTSVTPVSLDVNAVTQLYTAGNAATNGMITYTPNTDTATVTLLTQKYTDDNGDTQTDYTFKDNTGTAITTITEAMEEDVIKALKMGTVSTIQNVYTTQEQKSLQKDADGQYVLTLLDITDSDGKEVEGLNQLMNNATTSWNIVYSTDDGSFTYVGESGNTAFTVALSSLGGNFSDVSFDMSNTSNVNNGGKSTVAGLRDDGYKVGTLTGVSIGQDGVITANYDNGMQKSIAQISVATFANAMGLENAGDNLYVQTANSGEFNGVGVDIKGSGTGYMTTGVLEMSNVDLAQEFTNMITTQRGFQANSRIITTSDSLLEELVNLKR
jgi:flagellar hook protein FlgE